SVVLARGQQEGILDAAEDHLPVNVLLVVHLVHDPQQVRSSHASNPQLSVVSGPWSVVSGWRQRTTNNRQLTKQKKWEPVPLVGSARKAPERSENVNPADPGSAR